MYTLSSVKNISRALPAWEQKGSIRARPSIPFHQVTSQMLSMEEAIRNRAQAQDGPPKMDRLWWSWRSHAAIVMNCPIDFTSMTMANHL